MTLAIRTFIPLAPLSQQLPKYNWPGYVEGFLISVVVPRGTPNISSHFLPYSLKSVPAFSRICNYRRAPIVQFSTPSGDTADLPDLGI